jgi:hypothetical protein
MIMSQAGLNIAVLLADSSGRAIALDSVTFKREPFAVINTGTFSPDRHTRILLFARKVDQNSPVTVQAEDANHKLYALTIEYMHNVPDFDWLTELSVRLPDGPSGEVWITISVRGVVSNKALVRIQ